MIFSWQRNILGSPPSVSQRILESRPGAWPDVLSLLIAQWNFNMDIYAFALVCLTLVALVALALGRDQTTDKVLDILKRFI